MNKDEMLRFAIVVVVEDGAEGLCGWLGSCCGGYTWRVWGWEGLWVLCWAICCLLFAVCFVEVIVERRTGVTVVVLNVC